MAIHHVYVSQAYSEHGVRCQRYTSYTVQTDLNSLAQALNTNIPAKNDTNLLIATCNLRRLGSLTREWTTDAADTSKRDLRGLRTICEINSRYDVVAIQEVTGDLPTLRDMMSFLGPNWSFFLMTDRTLGAAGNDARMAFLFDNTSIATVRVSRSKVLTMFRILGALWTISVFICKFSL